MKVRAIIAFMRSESRSRWNWAADTSMLNMNRPTAESMPRIRQVPGEDRDLMALQLVQEVRHEANVTGRRERS